MIILLIILMQDEERLIQLFLDECAGWLQVGGVM